MQWRYEGANWDTLTSHLTHLIFFSAEPSPEGSLWGLDRLPRPELLEDAKAAAKRNGAKLLVCFGGNGRSTHFSATVRSKANRARFVKEAVALMDRLGVDGVDYNWEYPARRVRTVCCWQECVLRRRLAHRRLSPPETDLFRAPLQGYSFGSGYQAEQETRKDYEGLAALVKARREPRTPDVVLRRVSSLRESPLAR